MGTAYHGWQRQAQAVTIQGVMEKALKRLLKEEVSLLASGRTDAGVHALGQAAAFRTTSSIPLAGLVKGLNSILPDDISVLSAKEVPDSFHPIASAVKKRYCYRILICPVRLPLFTNRAWRLTSDLDTGAMKQAARYLLGTHDFSSFRAAGSSAESSVRTIFKLDIDERPVEEYSEVHASMVTITAEADGFLRYMVRNITGLLTDVGRGRLDPGHVPGILDAKDRRASSPTAPACGLYLMKVFYPQAAAHYTYTGENKEMGNKPSLADRVKNLKPSPTLAVDAKAKALKAKGVDIVNLSAGEPDFDTPDHIKEAAIKAIKEGFTKYVAVGGIPELKEAVINKLKRDYDLEYAPEQILVSTGGKQCLYNIAQAILNPGDQVIVPVPYWVSYPAIIELAGGVPVYLDSKAEENFAIDMGLLRSLVNEKTKAIILNSPSNPTGAVYSSEDLKAIAELAMEKGFYVITDDIYDEIRFDGKGPENPASLCPDAKEFVIIANGVSKTYAMTGWRIGYMAGPADVVKACTKIQSQSTSNANSIAQKAAAEALSGPQDCVKTMVEAFRQRGQFVIERLRSMPGISCVEPQGAFYVFPDVSSYYGKKAGDKTISGSLDMADYLLETAKIACVPGIAFGADDFIRFSYATDMKTLEEGLNRFEKALSELS